MNKKTSQHWWLTTVIPATWEAKVRKFLVTGQPMQIVREIHLQKTRTK
jgi:hypothetical protein